MTNKHKFTTIVLMAGLVSACGLEDALNDLANKLATPEATKAYSALSAALLDDSLSTLELGEIANIKSVVPQRSLSLTDAVVNDNAAPSFEPMAGLSAIPFCNLDIPALPTLAEGHDTEAVGTWCNLPDGSGNVYTTHHSVITAGTHWHPHQYAVLDDPEHPFYGVPLTPTITSPKGNPIGVQKIVIGAVNSAFTRGKFNVTLSVSTVSNPTFDTDTDADLQDVFNNPAIAVKTISSTDEATKIKSITERFEANMNGTPDDLRARYGGLNGVTDAQDDIWFYSELREWRNGRLKFSAALAAEGETFTRENEELVPGDYVEVVTPATGPVAKIEGWLTYSVDGDAQTVSTRRVFTHSDGTTEYTLHAIDSNGNASRTTVRAAFTRVDSISAADKTFTRKATFNDGDLVSIDTTGSFGDSGATFTRTYTFSDDTTVEENGTIASTDTSVTITYTRDNKTTTVTRSRNDDGTYEVKVETSDLEATIVITATLDESGEGEVVIAIDLDSELDGDEISGTLIRAADGTLTGTLDLTDSAGDISQVEVNEKANPAKGLVAKARADAKASASTDTATDE